MRYLLILLLLCVAAPAQYTQQYPSASFFVARTNSTCTPAPTAVQANAQTPFLWIYTTTPGEIVTTTRMGGQLAAYEVWMSPPGINGGSWTPYGWLYLDPTQAVRVDYGTIPLAWKLSVTSVMPINTGPPIVEFYQAIISDPAAPFGFYLTAGTYLVR